jgi:galactosamine-6-phosphate isomerase
MKLIVVDTPEAVAVQAAELIAGEWRAKPGSLLCAPTGSTPTRAYELLAEKRKKEPALFDAMRVVKLDEWGQLPMDDPGSCEAYLRHHLLEPLKISSDRYLSFDSMAEPAAECARVEKALDRQGPIDLCLLGLGANGHLGFNEPAEALDPLPHRAELTPTSLQHSMVRHAKMQLSYGLTLGMKHLLESRKIVLLVTGAHKFEPMKQLLSGKVMTQFPASFLWLHPDAICLCDRAAMTELGRK